MNAPDSRRHPRIVTGNVAMKWSALLSVPAVSYYFVMAFMSLLAIIALLETQNAVLPAIWPAVIFAIGACGIYFRAAVAPILVVVAVAATNFPLDRWRFQVVPAGPPLQIGDMLLAAATLFHVVGCYRLMAACQRRPSQRSAQSPAPAPNSRDRPTEPGAPMPNADFDEVLRLAAVLNLFPVLALWVMWFANFDWSLGREFGLEPVVVALITLFWTLGSITIVVVLALGYAERSHRSPAVAEVELVDLVWREHRSEFASVARALAREAARVRRRR